MFRPLSLQSVLLQTRALKKIEIAPPLTFLRNFSLCFKLPWKLSPNRSGDLIDLIPDSRPVSRPRCRTSAFEEEEVRNTAEEPLSQGVIRPSASLWTALFSFASKKGGKLRFCVHYRALNKQTIRNYFPIHRTMCWLIKQKAVKSFPSSKDVSIIKFEFTNPIFRKLHFWLLLDIVNTLLFHLDCVMLSLPFELWLIRCWDTFRLCPSTLQTFWCFPKTLMNMLITYDESYGSYNTTSCMQKLPSVTSFKHLLNSWTYTDSRRNQILP
jgi:hypothetical protein